MYDGKTIVFLIRGIAGHPSDQQEWEYRAADHVILKPHIPARAISYSTSFLTVWRRRQWRARRFSKVLRKYTTQDWRVHIIAHSEGTVVALDSMKLAGWPRVESVQLVCGACDSDFERNGLNGAIRTEKIGKVFCYTAGRDWAMRWENLVLGRVLFGIPERSWPLGLVGPRNVSSMPLLQEKVVEVADSPWDGYGHSTCWTGDKFDRTMRELLANAGV